MNNPYEHFLDHPLRGIFGPFAWPGTFARLLYLMIGFPLGLAWFVLYVTGFSVGIGLAIISIGVVILLGVLLAVGPLTLLERWLAQRLLGVRIGDPGFRAPGDEGFWRWMKNTLGNRVTWTGLLFLLLRFPLGLATWVSTIVMLSVSSAFIAAPIVWWFGGNISLDGWHPDTFVETLPLTLLGMVLLLPSVHAINGLGWLWGQLARLLLGRREPKNAAVQPARSMELAPTA